MSGHRNRSILIIATLLALTIGGTVKGDFITTLGIDLAPQADGLTRYDYTLSNESTSTLPVFQFSLDVSSDADLTILSTPIGWDIFYASGDVRIVWTSPDSATDLLPGQSFVFSFTSVLEPSSTGYLISGIDDAIPDVLTNEGLIAGPGVSAVPEPSTLTLLASVVLGLIAYTLRCRTLTPFELS